MTLAGTNYLMFTAFFCRKCTPQAVQPIALFFHCPSGISHLPTGSSYSCLEQDLPTAVWIKQKAAYSEETLLSLLLAAAWSH